MVSFRLTDNDIKVMCDSINECYGAMTYLGHDFEATIEELASKFKFVYLVRYILIFAIGFFPLILLVNDIL